MILRLFLATLALHAQQTVWKTYPVYHPDQAPPGYIEWLRAQQPEQIANPDGETLFEYPAIIGPLGARPHADPPFLHDKAWFDQVKPPLTREGTITGLVYVLRTKGKVEIGSYSCAGCHNRVLPNGAVIRGGQGNFPFDMALSLDLLASLGQPPLREENKALFARLYGRPEPNLSVAAKLLAAGLTPQIPDIVGAPSRRYLTYSARWEITAPEDFLRYLEHKQRLYNPAARPSPAELQAIAQYIGALKSPPSPYKADKFTRQGEKVFQRENCGSCHTPETQRVDPNAVGTGASRAPSLRGLWHRGPLGHKGEGTSLEDWLSPARLSYLKGHEYGLKLNGADRASLIAYLRTL